MTNSIINNDNTLMGEEKYKIYKQKFPPSIPFLKHALFRLSEVIYRIGLFALFWTVCGGLPFGVLLAFELLILFFLSNFQQNNGFKLSKCCSGISMDDWCLRVQSIIVLPSEYFYAVKGTAHQ